MSTVKILCTLCCIVQVLFSKSHDFQIFFKQIPGFCRVCYILEVERWLIIANQFVQVPKWVGCNSTSGQYDTHTSSSKIHMHSIY